MLVLLLTLIVLLFSSCDRTVPELPAPASTPVDSGIRMGVTPMELKLIKMVRPKLPEGTKQLSQKAQVVLEIKIDEAGNVAEVRVVQGSMTLIRAAEDAVKQWKYEPVLFEGKPMAIWNTVAVTFTDR